MAEAAKLSSYRAPRVRGGPPPPPPPPAGPVVQAVRAPLKEAGRGTVVVAPAGTVMPLVGEEGGPQVVVEGKVPLDSSAP